MNIIYLGRSGNRRYCWQEMLMERYILIFEIMEDLIITVKNVLASVFSDK